MPLGPFGEVVGTTGTLDALGEDGQNYKSKVIAPRNPKVVRSDDQEKKVTFIPFSGGIVKPSNTITKKGRPAQL